MSMVPSKLFSRYHANQTNSALMLRSELHWCPSPVCGRLLRLSHTKRVVSVNCDCGTFWCSGCKEEAHWPATCQQAKIYRQKAKDLFSKHLETFFLSIYVNCQVGLKASLLYFVFVKCFTTKRHLVICKGFHATSLYSKFMQPL